MDNQTIQPLIFEERWMPITEKSVPLVRPGAYLISDQGRVYSYLRNKYLDLVPTWNGYYRVPLRRIDNKCRYYLVHRIIMIEFNCIPEYQTMQVNHFDGDKSNNNIWNLSWYTASENILHAFRTGLKTKAKGEDCSYATITNEQADQIGAMLAEGSLNHKQIADIIGCNACVVKGIASCNNWKWVGEKYNLKSSKISNYNDPRISKEEKLLFSDDELHALCKYWENNKYKFSNLNDLFEESMKDTFNVSYSKAMYNTLFALYNKQLKYDISSQYNF